MTGRTIWYFIKFFRKEQYADEFIKGTLHLNRLSYFKKLENNDDDGRPDTNEAVAMWWQPHDVVIDLNVPGIGAVKITKEDLAAPVSISYEYHEHFHIFCLYAVHATGFATVDGKFDLAESEAAELRRQLAIDERCFKFGPFAVITPAVPFLAQLKEALQRRGQWFRGRLVEYYDDETFHGQIPLADIPFKKQKRFSYEKEFRICVHTNTKGDDPLPIDIGDISHISAKVDSSRLKDLLQLKPEPVAPHCNAPPEKPAG